MISVESVGEKLDVEVLGGVWRWVQAASGSGKSPRNSWKVRSFLLVGSHTPPAQFSSEALNTNAKHYAWKPCFSLTFPEKGIQKKVVYQQKVYPLHSSCVGSLLFF